jgi:hypothetical protein
VAANRPPISGAVTSLAAAAEHLAPAAVVAEPWGVEREVHEPRELGIGTAPASMIAASISERSAALPGAASSGLGEAGLSI